MEARGVYREMLTQAWHRGARLPNDHEAIQRAIGATRAEWRRSWPKVERFWRVNGEWLVNETQQLVYAEAQGVAQRASERGLRGAQAKHGHRSSGAQAVPESKPPNSELRTPVEERTSTDAARRLSRGNGDEGSFGLYCVIAREARKTSNEEDHSDALSNIAEIFKTLCARRQIDYAGDIAARALAAVMREGVGA
jgi:uncharacterized protein YdaU (DUF1376 family)